MHEWAVTIEDDLVESLAEEPHVTVARRAKDERLAVGCPSFTSVGILVECEVPGRG